MRSQIFLCQLQKVANQLLKDEKIRGESDKTREGGQLHERRSRAGVFKWLVFRVPGRCGLRKRARMGCELISIKLQIRAPHYKSRMNTARGKSSGLTKMRLARCNFQDRLYPLLRTHVTHKTTTSTHA